MDEWYVYMVRCVDGSLYTGCTNHLIRRWHQHRNGRGAKYLQRNKPQSVVYVEKHTSRSKACKREYEIKQLTKTKKESMIPTR
ncbi:MAG: GIY-YIG nuclease family protein [Balneolaceae bacterium]|nr:GIY-YIG nuclease family protein [Balneolaceae bacterium]